MRGNEPERALREERLRQVLRELSRAFAAALATQPEAGEQLRLLREEGFSLYLVLDGSRLEQAEEVPSSRRAAAPAFRIHGEDLVFLRSIGIDPTRRIRRRSG